MAATPREALGRLCTAADDGRLDAVCELRQVRVMSVFGSVLHAEQPRDLDVAVGFGPGVRHDILGVLDDLARITGSDDVDLLVLDGAGPVVRERALVGTVALYESEPGAFATAQMAAMCERMDTDWLRARQLRLLAR